MTINLKPEEENALEYASGLVMDPPSDEIGIHFLTWALPKKFRIRDNVLFDKETRQPAERRGVDPDKGRAKNTYYNYLRVAADKAKQTAGGSRNLLQLTTAPSTVFREAQPSKESAAAAVEPTIYPDETEFTQNNASDHDRTSPMAAEPHVEHEEHTFLEEKLSDRQFQLAFLSKSRAPTSTNGLHNQSREIRTSPLFSGRTLDSVGTDVFSQYGLLGEQMSSSNQASLNMGDPQLAPDNDDPRVFFNVSEPCSVFICGSQGSGKSYTLSCLLENCLIPSKLGRLTSPLRGMVFHYDAFTSYGSSQICEAAYLCSSGIPVQVLVAPTNFHRMREAYRKLPGLAVDTPRPQVIAMRFRERDLDSGKMMSMMAVNDRENSVPLYISVVLKILREMAVESCGAPGLDYNAFREKLDEEELTGQQAAPLKIRLELLESFMRLPSKGKDPDTTPTFEETQAGVHAQRGILDKSAQRKKDGEGARDSVWNSDPGTLTIVDLSCPHVGESAACSLFSICLELFMESRGSSSQVVALDEAHKFMTSNASATMFTEKLLQVIRQQRHLATRVIIATQEPSISPKLLDLSSMTIIHRFTSPAWFKVLRNHLAATTALGEFDNDGKTHNTSQIFTEIVKLGIGEALLFSPAAMLKIGSSNIHTYNDNKEGETAEKILPEKLGTHWAKVRVRMRLTEDGGKSIMAT